jgi:hypothetical protein
MSDEGEPGTRPQAILKALDPAERARRTRGALRLADALGEEAAHARGQLVLMACAMGLDFMAEALWITYGLLESDAPGGWLPDRSRRRTYGGVFFVAARAIGKPTRPQTSAWRRVWGREK